MISFPPAPSFPGGIGGLPLLPSWPGGALGLVSWPGDSSTRDPAPGGYLLDEQLTAAGVANGTNLAGAWRQRALSNEIFDDGNLATISANQITLQPGIYDCFIKCGVANATANYTRLQNVTDGATLLIGSNETAGAVSGWFEHSFIFGVFTIPSVKVLQIEHWSAQPGSAGTAVNLDPTRQELHVIAEFIRLGPF